jgi:hypothetical protein
MICENSQSKLCWAATSVAPFETVSTVSLLEGRGIRVSMESRPSASQIYQLRNRHFWSYKWGAPQSSSDAINLDADSALR